MAAAQCPYIPEVIYVGYRLLEAMLQLAIIPVILLIAAKVRSPSPTPSPIPSPTLAHPYPQSLPFPLTPDPHWKRVQLWLWNGIF